MSNYTYCSSNDAVLILKVACCKISVIISILFFICVQCEQQPAEEEEQEEEVVQQEIEAVIVGDDVEEEEAVVLQEDGCPAVIVEEVPSGQVEECYSAQVLVYDDETYLMQGVAEEQEVVTEVVETGKNLLCVYPEKRPNFCFLKCK